MNHILKAGLDFIIYSSLLISTAAAVLTLEIFYTSGIPINWPYIAFVFSSTFLIYALHRVIGITRIHTVNIEGRFETILKYRHHLKIYALLSSVVCVYIFLKYFEYTDIIYFLPAGMIALPYVLPVFGNSRLRDFHFIKIFLIALTWAYVCVGLPQMLNDTKFGDLNWIAFFEKALFIFAITIPFDIRDAKIDRIENVKTIAGTLGPKKAYLISYSTCMIAIILLFCTLQSSSQAFFHHILICLVVYIPVLGLIRLSDKKSSDYYYSGLLDASILIRSGLLLIFLQ
ncbi:MAG: hypothetical protein HKN09_05035 [Saprospiraceae bacterium]|nr:hypothetical protein [Saprospiraceae bacterium]